MDVETHERDKWVVAHEGKGLNFVLEILLAGGRAKDLDENVERFARLGISEYFVFDRSRARLHGFALPAGASAYQALVPQGGRWPSRVLGLDLGLESNRVRFFYGTAPVLDSEELLERANVLLERALAERAEAERRAEDEARRASDEARRAEDEARRAEDEARRASEEARRGREAEKRLAEALAEIERLKGL